MITAMFLMLFSLAMYIEWGLKQDQKEQRAQKIILLKAKNEYLSEQDSLSDSICS